MVVTCRGVDRLDKQGSLFRIIPVGACCNKKLLDETHTGILPASMDLSPRAMGGTRP